MELVRWWSASTNNNGAIQSSVSANTKAGFSIVSYTGTGSASTVGHGLTQVKLILVKNRDDATKNWNVYATILGNNYLELNNGNVTFTGANYFNNTLSTNTVFSVGSLGSTNGNGNGMIAYCFHSVDGFSKVGRYISNNSADEHLVTQDLENFSLNKKNTISVSKLDLSMTIKEIHTIRCNLLYFLILTLLNTHQTYFM